MSGSHKPKRSWRHRVCVPIRATRSFDTFVGSFFIGTHQTRIAYCLASPNLMGVTIRVVRTLINGLLLLDHVKLAEARHYHIGDEDRGETAG